MTKACTKCNMGLGYLQDSVKTLENLASMLIAIKVAS